MLVDWLDPAVLRATGHAFDWNRVEGLGPETLSGIRHVHDQPDGHFSAQLNFAIQNPAQQQAFEALMARLDGMRNTVDIPVPLERVPRKPATSVLVGPHLAGSYRAVIARPEWADVEVLQGQFIGIGGAVHKVLAVDTAHADGIELALLNPLRRDFLPDSGAELMANGTFDADISGWTPVVAGASTVTWDSGSGRMQFDHVGADYCRAWAGVATSPGRRYRARADTTGDVSIWLGVNGAGQQYGLYINAPGASFHFIARTAMSYLTFSAYEEGTHYADNVSIIEEAGAVVTTRPVCRMRLASPGQGQNYYDLNRFANPALSFVEDMFDQ